VRRVLVAGLLCVGVLAACSNDGDNSETPVLSIGTTEGTTCLNIPGDLPAEVEKLPTIDCAEPHTHQVFWSGPYVDKAEPTKSDVYPGVETLDAFAQAECLTQFQIFVGISAFDSTLFYSWLVPTLKSWQDHDDRAILCVLGMADGSLLPGGTMRGKKI
jgi:hypothetical protein